MRRLFVFLLLMMATPAQAAERVLALAPHVCEMLYAIGAARQIVGAVDFCDYPAAARRLPRVGNYRGVNVEATLRLHPDLAVAAAANVKGLAQLRAFGVRVVVSNPHDFTEMLADLMRLGRLTGHAPQARQVAERLRRAWDGLKSPRRKLLPVFYELWPEPLMTAGGRIFINDLIEAAGGRNVFAGIDAEAPRVSLEAVLRAHPRLIVIPDEKRELAARRDFWRHWLKDEHLCVASIDHDLLHRPGPRLVLGLKALRAAVDRCAAKQGYVP